MKVIFETNKTKGISRIIRFFTKSRDITGQPISHAAPIYGNAFGCEWCLSADEVLINVVDVNRYRKPGYVFRIYEIPDIIPSEQWVPKVNALYNQRVYPHFELLWFMYRWLRRLVNPQWTGKNWFSYSEFCSELTILALREAGYAQYFENVDANATDAIELENIVREIPGAKMIEYWNDELQVQ